MMFNCEIHHGEAVEEKISLPGRFGIPVAFHPFCQWPVFGIGMHLGLKALRSGKV